MTTLQPAPVTRRVQVRLASRELIGTALGSRLTRRGPQTLVQAGGRLLWVRSDRVQAVDLPTQRTPA